MILDQVAMKQANGHASPSFDSVTPYQETLTVLTRKLADAGWTHPRPKLGIVCGSGLGGLVDALDKVVLSVPYSELPNFSPSTVAGHAGKLVFGELYGKPVVIMVGRLHFYEGYSQRQTTFPIAILCLLGIELILLTNAAGGVNLSYKKGDIMILRDHVALPCITGTNPLIGPVLDLCALKKNFASVACPDPKLRFPPLNNLYPQAWQRQFARAAVESGLEKARIHSGRYAYLSGPAYETAGEIHLLRTIGADAVGMSTIPEALVAKQMGVPVLAFSLISNEVPDFPPIDEQAWLWGEDDDVPAGRQGATVPATRRRGSSPLLGTAEAEAAGPSHAEVIEATAASARALTRAIATFVQGI